LLNTTNAETAWIYKYADGIYKDASHNHYNITSHITVLIM